MRNRIFGAIGVIWGGFVILSLLNSGMPAGNSNAYNTGQYIGAGFGVLMFAAGLYYLIKGDGAGSKKKTKKKKNVMRTPS